MTERTYGDSIVTEYQLIPNNLPSQVFKTNLSNIPTLVMVGAHDGVNGEQYGLMKFLENLNDFNLYLIEPMESFFNQLHEVYGKFGDKVKYLNYAITEKNSTDTIMIDMGIMSQIANFIMPEGEKIKDGDVFVSAETEAGAQENRKEGHGSNLRQVDSKKWQDFVEENCINDIDVLLLDCEGCEFDILKEIDYSKTPPKSIRYEYAYCSKLTDVQHPPLHQLWKKETNGESKFICFYQNELDNFLIEKGYSITLDDTDPEYNKVAIKGD